MYSVAIKDSLYLYIGFYLHLIILFLYFSSISMFLLLFIHTTKNSSMLFWESTSVFFIVVTCTYEPLMESHYMSWPSTGDVLCQIVMNVAVLAMDAKDLFT